MLSRNFRSTRRCQKVIAKCLLLVGCWSASFGGLRTEVVTVWLSRCHINIYTTGPRHRAHPLSPELRPRNVKAGERAARRGDRLFASGSTLWCKDDQVYVEERCETYLFSRALFFLSLVPLSFYQNSKRCEILERASFPPWDGSLHLCGDMCWCIAQHCYAR